MRAGVLTAIGIAIHNFTEGISMSIPIWESTGSRKRAFLYSFAAVVAVEVDALVPLIV